MTGIDVQDFFLMQETADKQRYVMNGEELEYEVIEHRIKVKGADDVTIRTRRTVLGPVLNENGGLEYFGDDLDCLYYDSLGVPVVLHWPILSPHVRDRTLHAFMQISRAQNWQEYRQAISFYVGPSQNLVYADVDGNIGYQMPGVMPVRRFGHTGMWPVPGNGSFAWVGQVPYSEMPRTLNPPEKFIANGNNRVTPTSGYDYFLTRDWCSGDDVR